MNYSLNQTSTVTSITLILGGARSGKSAFAETLAEQGERPTYIATGQIFDTEMRQRVMIHQQRRGSHWTTVEEPLELATAVLEYAQAGRVVLVDCLTLWLANLMHAQRDIANETDLLINALADKAGPVLLVSNEVGLGIVPDNALARQFRDHAGQLHQAIAAVAERVYFVVAGIPMTVK